MQVTCDTISWDSTHITLTMPLCCVSRSLNKMNTYRSRIHPVVMGGGPRWSGHAYHSTPVAPRASPGNMSSMEAGLSGRGIDQGSGGGNPHTAPVTIYDALSLLPIDLQLAQLYRQVFTYMWVNIWDNMFLLLFCCCLICVCTSLSGGSIEEICSQNATIASHKGRADLVKAWSTAALVASDIAMVPPPSPTSMPWPRHPFCRSLIKSLYVAIEAAKCVLYESVYVIKVFAH